MASEVFVEKVLANDILDSEQYEIIEKRLCQNVTVPIKLKVNKFVNLNILNLVCLHKYYKYYYKIVYNTFKIKPMSICK